MIMSIHSILMAVSKIYARVDTSQHMLSEFISNRLILILSMYSLTFDVDGRCRSYSRISSLVTS